MNQTPIHLVIFDCDGVLVDSEPLGNRVFVQMLREHGFEVNEEKYLKKFIGKTLPDRIATVAGEFNWSPPENFLPIFHERLADLSDRELEVVPGIQELINNLDVPIAIASNGTRKEIIHRLEYSNLTERFGNAIFSGMEVPNPKPAPDVYLAAAKAFDVHPSNCFVVEDSIPGVTAAVRAGMKVYGHAAFTPVDALKEAGAIPFANMFELKEIFAREFLQVQLNS